MGWMQKVNKRKRTRDGGGESRERGWIDGEKERRKNAKGRMRKVAVITILPGLVFDKLMVEEA